MWIYSNRVHDFTKLKICATKEKIYKINRNSKEEREKKIKAKSYLKLRHLPKSALCMSTKTATQ